MADFFIEYVTLGEGASQDNVAEAVVSGLVSSTSELTPSATTLSTKPTVPTGSGKTVVAIMTNTGTDARKASWGGAPNATSDGEFIVVPAGFIRAVVVPSGDKIDVVNA